MASGGFPVDQGWATGDPPDTDSIIRLQTVPEAADSKPSSRLQVQVNVSEDDDVAPNIPVGKMTSGGHPAPVEVAPRLQTAAEVAKFSYRTTCTTPPAINQVQVNTTI